MSCNGNAERSRGLRMAAWLRYAQVAELARQTAERLKEK